MSYRLLWIVPILAAMLIGQEAAAANASAPPSHKIDPQDLKNIMLVKDIKPGMRGYGKTVFQGTKVETFQTEVLGILRKVIFGADLIIVKLSGGPITKRGANLISGMSGSPIYINGKIIGAFSYGEPFGKEPIGLVTPIENMLEAWDPTLPSKPTTFYPFSTVRLDKPITLNGRSFGKVAIGSDTSRRDSYDPSTLVFEPLATPIMVSGMSPRIVSRLQESLEPYNVRLVPGPGPAADKANLNVDLQPGSAIGMSLVTGDVDLTGIGTLTYRRGNKVIAFGHPMLGLGSVDAGLTTAYVYDIFPSLFVSSKISGPLKPVGRFYQDRPWSVAGEIGKQPTMIPVTVHLKSQSPGRERVFRVQVMSHPIVTFLFLSLVASEGVSEMVGAPTDATARVKVAVTADEVGTITRENVFFDTMQIDMATVSELQQIMTLLQFNPFYPVSVKRVDMWVDMVPKHQTAKLERIFLKESKFEPGDTVEVGAVIRPFKGDRITRTIKIKLPKNMPNGQMSLQVTGGATPLTSGAMYSEEEPMPLPWLMLRPPGAGQPQPAFDNLQQMIKKFLEREKNNELVARVTLPKPVPTIAGEKLPGLPPSIAGAMRSSKATTLATDRDEIKEIMPTDWVMFGRQRLSITVEKTEKGEKKSAARKAPEPSMDEESEAEPEVPGVPDGESEESEEDFSMLTAQLGPELVELPDKPAAGDKPEKANGEAKPAKEGESGKAEEKPADKEGAKPAAADEKPVGRAPSVWKQTARAEFLQGTLTDVAATTGDLLTLAGSLKPMYESSETYIWCVLPDGKGNVYAGTGNHGIIYKIAADNSASVVYDSPELEIHSLATDSAGNVYAGTSPNGMVYKIGPDGKASTLFDAEEKYIVALALDSKGNIYAATGDKCRVYKISPDGKANAVLDSSEQHALSLAVDNDDNVYVGTGLNGLIYKISPAGAVSALYDAKEDSVTALAVDPKGILFAGTSPKGIIYKLAPGATPKAVYEKAGQGITGISADGSGNVYAVNAANVFEIMADETVCTLENKDDVQFLCLALGDGKLYAGTGNIGSVYSANVGKTTVGTYESPVHDCGQTSSWGVIDWTVDLPNGTSLTLQTRTGNATEPGSTWSEWSAAYTAPGAKIASPPGRYVQYLAALKAADPSSSPKVKDISVVYLPKNQAPKVSVTSPKGGEKWARKKTIKWTGSDPDKDTLAYELFYSTDGGKTWQPLSDKIKAAAPEKKENEEPAEEEEGPTEDEALKPEPPNPEQILAEMTAELEKHPEIPQEFKDKMVAEATAVVEEAPSDGPPVDEEAKKPTEEPEAKPAGISTKQTTFSWDTAKFKDGTYLIKVVGSDRLCNPSDPLQGEVICDPITVCNKPPKVVAFKKTLTVQADKSVRVEGVAYHDMVGIAGVQYKVASEDWAAAAPSDGIFDTPFETFVITTRPLPKGNHKLDVKAIDQAGNAATTKVKVKVE